MAKAGEEPACVRTIKRLGAFGEVQLNPRGSANLRRESNEISESGRRAEKELENRGWIGEFRPEGTRLALQREKGEAASLAEQCCTKIGTRKKIC
ncbi:hypothetical protein PRIPAC_81065 [Pristionchus pacificus]|uniref:Uncharacterized protein n=1 Tax=Pristionchus pacificus TaxID=54126 RepID=A0A2A6CKY5_PRIPA|nr:hypothetical protein PRIPAC_81065 [Pristionchus pacificus]|eukprot:PDM78862.1 hypothetical protein PRIPAC_31441 [Pristionchus pacificus]